MSEPRLANKVALITGASRGQGEAEARMLGAAGASIVVADVLDEQGEALAEELRRTGIAARYHHLDVRDESNWEDVVRRVAEDFGALHVLVNNAGVSHREGRVMNTDVADWDRVLAINLAGPWLGIKACAPLLRDSGGGSIVNTGSIAGLLGHFALAYSVSKWGLRGLTKCAALELLPWKIRVNAIHPALVTTPLFDSSDDFLAAMQWMTPMQRPSTAAEIAAVVLFLASDESSFITGIDVPVDGGFVDLGQYHKVVERVTANPNPAWG